jgi:hypothetical protein
VKVCSLLFGISTVYFTVSSRKSNLTFPDGSDDASSKEVHLRFLLNPMRYEPQEDDPTSLGSVVCERTFLEGKPDEQKAVGTGTYETLAAQLVRRRMTQRECGIYSDVAEFLTCFVSS